MDAMKKYIQDRENHKIVSAYYKCIICHWVDPMEKVAALPAVLPAFHEAWCPKCKANRKFIQVK
jgi:rubredoxin